MSYSSLEQRLAQGYLDMLPSFVPDENAPVSISEQERFYNLIRSLYQLASCEPLLFVTALHEDDAFPGRYKKGYDKPKLIGDMKKFTKAVNALVQAMFLAGQGGEIKLNKRQVGVLVRLGIDNLTNLPAAWRWMATREGASLPAFSHCLFNGSYSYTSEIYARLLGEPAFKKLENWMLERGYRRYDVFNTTASDCDLLLTIANPEWSAEPPRGGFEYKIKHTGISAQFDYYVKTPAVFGLCIPGGLKDYLNSFDDMDKELQAFVAERTKKCDNCRYCVQTDKTGSRPLACITIEFEGKKHRLCPYFPGYSYSWTSIDDELADKLMRMLSFMDRFAPNNKMQADNL